MPVTCWAAEPGCLTSRVSLRAGKVKQEPTLYREGPPYQRRGSLQLWQFLVTLLDDPANAHFIAWTGRGMEFKLIEPEEVWGSCTGARAAARERLQGVPGGAGWILPMQLNTHLAPRAAFEGEGEKPATRLR